MTLVEFLTARVNEDAAWAGCTCDACPGEWCDAGCPTCRGGDRRQRDPDKARALREVMAMRTIVRLHATDDHVCWWTDDPQTGLHVCDTLRALAAVYADHPDYSHEWDGPDDE